MAEPWFAKYVASFLKDPGQYDAGGYGVRQEWLQGARWQIIGVHHLDQSENANQANCYICVMDKAGQPDGQAILLWSWEGRIDPPIAVQCGNERNRPAAVVSIADIANCSFWMDEGASDRVYGVDARQPDEPPGNVGQRHSYLLVFQRQEISMGDYKIYDVLGAQKDEAWLQQQWGVMVDTSLRRANSDNFQLLALREIEGPAIYRVKVLDKDGMPWSGRYVGRSYPSAPNSWPGGTKPDNVPAPPEGVSHVVFGSSDGSGNVEFATGTGDYAGPGQGVTSVWLAEHYAGTDCVKKLGMKPNTQHRTISPTFQYVLAGTPSGDPDKPPTPEPDNKGCLYNLGKLLMGLGGG